jgi:hypothetical protein
MSMMRRCVSSVRTEPKFSSNARLQRIFTDAHLHIDTVFDAATAFIDKIERFYEDKGMITSRRANVLDLVLDLVKSEDGMGCGYYFVDHLERIVFWDDAFKLEWLSHGQEVQGVTSAQHIGEEVCFVFRIDSSPMISPETELEVQFWCCVFSTLQTIYLL